MSCHERPGTYQIRVKGHLGPDWSSYFGDLRIVNEPDGDGVLIGPLTDQAALHAVIIRIRDLGLPLISVTRIDSETETT